MFGICCVASRQLAQSILVFGLHAMSPALRVRFWTASIIDWLSLIAGPIVLTGLLDEEDAFFG